MQKCQCKCKKRKVLFCTFKFVIVWYLDLNLNMCVFGVCVCYLWEQVTVSFSHTHTIKLQNRKQNRGMPCVRKPETCGPTVCVCMRWFWLIFFINFPLPVIVNFSHGCLSADARSSSHYNTPQTPQRFWRSVRMSVSLARFREINLPKTIIYSPSCGYKPKWLSFFHGAQKKIFIWMFTLLFFIVNWKLNISIRVSHRTSYRFKMTWQWEND